LNYVPSVGLLKQLRGVQERKVASDSLAALAGQLTGAHTALTEKLVGRSDVPEHHSLDSFFQTIKAVPDVRTCVPLL
jgi:hypothetical protein